MRVLYTLKSTVKFVELHIYFKMEARELRIDNLVNCGFNIVPIKSIHTESVLKNEVRVYVELNEKLQNYCLDITEIKPIPLTEEWLIKFGFQKVIYDTDETGYGTDYELDIKGVGCISYSDDFSCALFGSKESSKNELGFLPNWDNCKHVHSLQNLYFALIGEELKIKE